MALTCGCGSPYWLFSYITILIRLGPNVSSAEKWVVKDIQLGDCEHCLQVV